MNAVQRKCDYGWFNGNLTSVRAQQYRTIIHIQPPLDRAFGVLRVHYRKLCDVPSRESVWA